MNINPLTLNHHDPKVIAAREAEQELFAHYQIRAKTHYINLAEQGIRVRVLEIGQGEPLVVVPGNTGDVFPMASLLAELKGRRIFAINRPGGGLSEGMDYTTVDIRKFAVATLAAVIDAFKLTNVDIVAHSIGGHWSLWLAMDRPELVRSLTLLGNPGNVMKGKLPPVMRLLIRWPFNRVLARIVKGSDTNKKPTLLKLMGSSKETINSLPAVLGAAYFYFRRLPHYLISLISLLQNAAPKIDARQLCQVKQPARLLLGDKDTFATVATGESIAAAMPNCRLCVINDAGHLPWLEQPVECGNLIKDFFKML